MKSRRISIVCLMALTAAGLLTPPLCRTQIRSQGQRRPSGAQSSGEDRVRAFRGRRRDRRIEPAAQITLAQAQQMLEIKNFYASLSPRQTYVDQKGYLNFTFPASSERGEISGQNNTAHLPSFVQVLEIGVRSSAPEKNYRLQREGTRTLLRMLLHHPWA